MKNLGRNKIFSLAIFSALILTACGKSAFVDMAKEKDSSFYRVQPNSDQDISENDLIISDDDARSEDEEPDRDSDNPTVKPKPTPTPNIRVQPVPSTTVTTTTLRVRPQPPVVQLVQIKIESETRLRTLRQNILESIHTLGPGDIIEIDKNSQPVSYNYRIAGGKIEFASSGFYAHVKIIKTGLSDEDLKILNAVETGLYITSLVVSGTHGDADNTYAPLVSRQPGEGYQKYFQDNGKPKNAYTRISTERFSKINKGVDWASMKPEEQKKWSAIMAELQKVADRTRRSPRDLMIIERSLAIKISMDFEKNETVQGKGAWSVSVDGTAKRNGFENVPCAEFVGEVIRQAYFRAGYKHQDDFNKEKGNVLNYDNGASAVVYLSAYLAKAEWVAWNSQIYAPALGAILMHKNGTSPGHTYISAGSNGRFIIDNSSPQGRDLRAASERSIADMYQTGVFFLPPGFTPLTWEQVGAN